MRHSKIIPFGIAALLTILLLCVGTVFNSPHGHVDGPIPSAPTATTPTLPTCTEEDGAGQALCTWDAATQGNRQGHNTISGDCAPYINGVKGLCVRMHNKGQQGADAVAECTQMYFDGNATEAHNCILEKESQF